MSGEELKVTITLRKPIAERLRRMCHAKGITASLLIDKWVFEHDDAGELLKPKQTAEERTSELLRKLVRGGFGR